jgi:hypothetical protein
MRDAAITPVTNAPPLGQRSLSFVAMLPTPSTSDEWQATHPWTDPTSLVRSDLDVQVPDFS